MLTIYIYVCVYNIMVADNNTSWCTRHFTHRNKFNTQNNHLGHLSIFLPAFEPLPTSFAVIVQAYETQSTSQIYWPQSLNPKLVTQRRRGLSNTLWWRLWKYTSMMLDKSNSTNFVNCFYINKISSENCVVRDRCQLPWSYFQNFSSIFLHKMFCVMT